MQHAFDQAQFPKDSDSYTEFDYVGDQEDDMELEDFEKRKDVYDLAQKSTQGPSMEISLGEGAMNLVSLTTLEPPCPSSMLAMFLGC